MQQNRVIIVLLSYTLNKLSVYSLIYLI